ncbi:hypothetical protein ACJ73_00560 [Blastomyces percursus]|uniref:Uncharacterized protein n=1 Tax=Blastomyces percursus TaxID=1658174 RepID=A0A1J9QGR8_9EURO|nr:hypothetical protein ACJ73_00560 [Blastomyces percursus]
MTELQSFGEIMRGGFTEVSDAIRSMNSRSIEDNNRHLKAQWQEDMNQMRMQLSHQMTQIFELLQKQRGSGSD